MSWTILALVSLLAWPINADEVPNKYDLRDDSTLLRRSDVRKEIELIDDQTEAFERAKMAMRERLEEFRQTLRSKTLEEKSVANKAHLVEMMRSQQATRQEVLLPHQLRRLAQLRWQYRAIDDPVKSIHQAFDVTDDQEQRLIEIEVEMRAKWLKEMWAFYRKSQQEILQVLTPQQRAAWEKKAGDEFQFESSLRGLRVLNRLK